MTIPPFGMNMDKEQIKYLCYSCGVIFMIDIDVKDKWEHCPTCYNK